MLNEALFVGSLCYGVVSFFLLNKKGKRYDAVIIFLLSCFIAGYNAPFIEGKWPTVEILYSGLYKSLSQYIFQQILIK